MALFFGTHMEALDMMGVEFSLPFPPYHWSRWFSTDTAEGSSFLSILAAAVSSCFNSFGILDSFNMIKLSWPKLWPIAIELLILKLSREPWKDLWKFETENNQSWIMNQEKTNYYRKETPAVIFHMAVLDHPHPWCKESKHLTDSSQKMIINLVERPILA